MHSSAEGMHLKCFITRTIQLQNAFLYFIFLEGLDLGASPLLYETLCVDNILNLSSKIGCYWRHVMFMLTYRGFCFVEFDTKEGLDKVLSEDVISAHTIDGRKVEVRKAIPHDVHQVIIFKFYFICANIVYLLTL